MSLATKNNALILKGGSLARNCACCGASGPCCPGTSFTKAVVEVSGVKAKTGDPFPCSPGSETIKCNDFNVAYVFNFPPQQAGGGGQTCTPGSVLFQQIFPQRFCPRTARFEFEWLCLSGTIDVNLIIADIYIQNNVDICRHIIRFNFPAMSCADIGSGVTVSATLLPVNVRDYACDWSSATGMLTLQ